MIHIAVGTAVASTAARRRIDEGPSERAVEPRPIGFPYVRVFFASGAIAAVIHGAVLLVAVVVR